MNKINLSVQISLKLVVTCQSQMAGSKILRSILDPDFIKKILEKNVTCLWWISCTRCLASLFCFGLYTPVWTRVILFVIICSYAFQFRCFVEMKKLWINFLFLVKIRNECWFLTMELRDSAMRLHCLCSHLPKISPCLSRFLLPIRRCAWNTVMRTILTCDLFAF